jgi:hypothetical protein
VKIDMSRSNVNKEALIKEDEPFDISPSVYKIVREMDFEGKMYYWSDFTTPLVRKSWIRI